MQIQSKAVETLKLCTKSITDFQAVISGKLNFKTIPTNKLLKLTVLQLFIQQKFYIQGLSEKYCQRFHCETTICSSEFRPVEIS